MRWRTRKKCAGAKIRQIAANPLAAFAACFLRLFHKTRDRHGRRHLQPCPTRTSVAAPNDSRKYPCNA